MFRSVGEEAIEVVDTDISWSKSSSDSDSGIITATTTLRNTLNHPVSFQLYVTFKKSRQWGESEVSFVDIGGGETVETEVEKEFSEDGRPSEYAVQIVNPKIECP